MFGGFVCFVVCFVVVVRGFRGFGCWLCLGGEVN